jgi:BASS family bile acid:Na+ symporter
MATPDSRPGHSPLTKSINRIHSHFLWLLLGCYALAAMFPEPGLAIREFSLGSKARVPFLLLALLLFCASAVVRWSQVRDLLQRPGILLIGLIAIWIVPGIFVSALGWILPGLLGKSATTGMLVGLAIVAAMPVANSSVAWSQNAHGNVALGLGLIVLTIVLCPVATPQMLNLMRLSLSSAETEKCTQLVRELSGTFFIVWVILPALAGVVFNRILGPQRIDRSRGSLRLLSAITLLMLNYVSASLAFSGTLDDNGAQILLFGEEAGKTIIVSGLLAIALSVLGIVSAWVISRALKLGRASWTSLIFGLSMKHTGLALVLAGNVLHEEPRVMLMILLATLLQHVVAGAADWYLARHGGREGKTVTERQRSRGDLSEKTH